jgi:outer membrane protein assembly factor BamB
VIWEHEDKARFTEPVAGPGPRATPTFEGGKIYTLGALGTLDCLDAATGKLLWQKNVMAEAGRDKLAEVDQKPYWGYSSSPLVTHGVVIVIPGGPAKNPPPDKAVLAFDAATGALKWSAGKGGHTYVSAELAKLQGVDQVLSADELGVFSYDPTTGQELWHFDWKFENGQRCCQPAVIGDSDFLIGTPMNQGLKRVRVTRDGSKWSTKEIWTSRAISPYFNDLVVHKGALYGFDGAFLTCANLEDGRRRWRVRGYGTGQVLLLADQDLLLVIAEEGDVALVAATPDEHRELPGRLHAINGKTWNHPVVAHGRLYVRNGEEAACYELPRKAEVAQATK